MNEQFMQGIQQVKGMMRQVQMMSNPRQGISQLMQQNPQMSQVMQICNGQNPKQVFYSMCQQRGVDPEQIINMLKS